MTYLECGDRCSATEGSNLLLCRLILASYNRQAVNIKSQRHICLILGRLVMDEPQGYLLPYTVQDLLAKDFLSHNVVLELASSANESCYLTVPEFRVIVLNISFDFNEESLLVKFVFCNNINFSYETMVSEMQPFPAHSFVFSYELSGLYCNNVAVAYSIFTSKNVAPKQHNLTKTVVYMQHFLYI